VVELLVEAFRRAIRLDQPTVGTEHLLFALLKGESAAKDLLAPRVSNLGPSDCAPSPLGQMRSNLSRTGRMTLSDSLPAMQNFDDMINTGNRRGAEFGADDVQSLFEHSGLCMVALDQYLVVQDVNADFARELRWRNARLRGRETLHFVHRSGHLHLGRQSGRLLHGKRARISEQVLAVSRSDEVVPARFTATAVHTGGEQDDPARRTCARPERAEGPALPLRDGVGYNLGEQRDDAGST
jgi:hypothetical protein